MLVACMLDLSAWGLQCFYVFLQTQQTKRCFNLFYVLACGRLEFVSFNSWNSWERIFDATTCVRT